MIELGLHSMSLFTSELTPLQLPLTRPFYYPSLDEDEIVILGCNQGSGERIIACESLKDMQYLYDQCLTGWATDVKWYSAKRPKFAFKKEET